MNIAEALFQYALLDGSDSCFSQDLQYHSFNTHSRIGVIQAFTKSGIKKSYKFCQTTKCSVLIITDL